MRSRPAQKLPRQSKKVHIMDAIPLADKSPPPPPPPRPPPPLLKLIAALLFFSPPTAHRAPPRNPPSNHRRPSQIMGKDATFLQRRQRIDETEGTGEITTTNSQFLQGTELNSSPWNQEARNEGSKLNLQQGSRRFLDSSSRLLVYSSLRGGLWGKPERPTNRRKRGKRRIYSNEGFTWFRRLCHLWVADWHKCPGDQWGDAKDDGHSS
ncbi:hypothetical protein B296_00045507 [Ensete ventricosum]|uniref:Uncharacterized protein n=1 Tax=Ensete ventricosum TaxID=4639 RepID=A0A426XQZ6_ENSVE|nr:hypothetical protein B296_00045507 [Ensete ventricosum]